MPKKSKASNKENKYIDNDIMRNKDGSISQIAITKLNTTILRFIQ